jgi:hypothetical protein
MREHALAGTLVQRLATHKRRQFADEQAWMQHLEHLGIAGLAVTPDPVRVATEGALWGAVNADTGGEFRRPAGSSHHLQSGKLRDAGVC